jgi:hypothetical protein
MAGLSPERREAPSFPMARISPPLPTGAPDRFVTAQTDEPEKSCRTKHECQSRRCSCDEQQSDQPQNTANGHPNARPERLAPFHDLMVDQGAINDPFE